MYGSDGVAAASAGGDAVERCTRFLDAVFPRPRAFDVRMWDGTVLPADHAARWTMVVNDPGGLRRMFTPPLEPALSDAYVSGAVDARGDLTACLEVVDGVRRVLASPGDVLRVAALWRALPRGREDGAASGAAAARFGGRSHSRERDRAAVTHHYDLGNDFYGLFLDRRMVYSCGYFAEGVDDLDTAQERKLDHVCRKLRLKPGERLLDVGCGWGGMLIWAAAHYGVSGVGITLSQRQEELARQRVEEAGLAGQVEIRRMDYRDLEPASFDKVSSIGMFEHVGRRQLPGYFAAVHAALRPGGLFLNHGVSRAGARPDLLKPLAAPFRALLLGKTNLTRAVFPDTELVPVSEVNAVAEAGGWEVRDVENLREHYAETLRHWIARLESNEEEAVALVGWPTYRLWKLYFAASARWFDTARINLCQTLLARPGEAGEVALPRSRADLYAPPARHAEAMRDDARAA